jgi:hypothetical protein
VLVLRSRADGLTVTKKSSLLETMILKRFLGRKQKVPKVIYSHV